MAWAIVAGFELVRMSSQSGCRRFEVGSGGCFFMGKASSKPFQEFLRGVNDVFDGHFHFNPHDPAGGHPRTLFGAHLQGWIHFFKTPLRLLIGTDPEERNAEIIELLVLPEPHLNNSVGSLYYSKIRCLVMAVVGLLLSSSKKDIYTRCVAIRMGWCGIQQ